MNTLTIYERGEQERDLARSWWHLTPQTLLALEDGRHCLLLYSGQPGGSAGPDVRDAVLRFLPCGKHEEATECTGDVEFHLRASDWFVHGHQNDPRYNQVILHVVFYPDSHIPTRRQDGTIVPSCSLLDPLQTPQQTSEWPCQQRPLAAQEIITTLLYAGLQRFSEKSQLFHQVLEETQSATSSQPGPQESPGLLASLSVYDRHLLPALAEGLGYGRDRAFFRAAGLRLSGVATPLPEPLGHTQSPAPLDARRLHILRILYTRWQAQGAWQTLSQELRSARDVKAALIALRAVLRPLSQARADILIVNIVLPFAAAVAGLENDISMAVKAQQILLAYPGLDSNRITRMMSAQLQLPEKLSQACLQQGLHHIYTHTCRTKRCETCLCGGQRL